ncbi:hypothetical protein C2845_PM07G13020 [Panicum miliaceum]|uniref:3'-5' exonuclease domain-containing protein n=1 Tax=Panicum miliaceum TaxID=4540 RepID=A0A3L6SU81_PANMI|nr:hypothetical protein C2845_PM07G13020 [Panicum miliaceum]
MKGPVEITLTRDTPSNRRCWWRRDDDLLDDGDVGVLRIGRGLAAVETTFSDSDEDRCWRKSRTGFRPNDHGNPIRCLALCLGGSRALVYSPEAFGHRVGKPAYAADQLDFDGNNMDQLRAFLDDNRITVACFGAREVTRKLAKEWGLHVAWPEELTDLFALAYGKVAGVEREERLLYVKKPAARYWLGKAALKREKAKAQRDEYDTDEEERLNNLGRTWRPPKVVRGLSLERMARVALGPEMRLARCPAKVAQADWGSYYLGKEEWAYLCFEIAARCLQKLGDPIGVVGSSSAKPAVAAVGMVRPAAVLSH